MNLSKRDLARAMVAVRKALQRPDADDVAERWLPSRCRIATVNLDDSWVSSHLDVVDDQPVIGLAPGRFGEPKAVTVAHREYFDGGSLLAYAIVSVSPRGVLCAGVADDRPPHKYREYTGQDAYEVLRALVRDDVRALVEMAQPAPALAYNKIAFAPQMLPANTDEGFCIRARGDGDTLRIEAERVVKRDSELTRAPGWVGYIVSPRVYGPILPPSLAELMADRCGWDYIDRPTMRWSPDHRRACAETWLLQHHGLVLQAFCQPVSTHAPAQVATECLN